MSVITKKISMPAVNAETKPQIKLEDLLARIEKLEKGKDGYDNGYGAPNDRLTHDNPTAAEEEDTEKMAEEEEEDAVPGVPGTHARSGREPDAGGPDNPDEPQKKDGYGKSDYVAPKTPNDPKAEEEEDSDQKVDSSYKVKATANDDDDDDDDGKDTVCEKCGSSYKAKKAAKKDDDDEEDEEEEENIMPKKEVALDFGSLMSVATPTKEELEAMKSFRFNKNEAFGIQPKKNNSVGRKMTQWAMQETARLTPKKS